MSDLISEVPKAFLQRHTFDNFVQSPFRRSYSSSFDRRLVALQALSSVALLLKQPIEARDIALSWRDYRVGSVVLAYNLETGAMGTFVGGNVKPQPEGGLNLHAEQIAIAKARAASMSDVMAISVIADPNNQDANPTGAPTLRPCRRCSKMFEDSAEVDGRTRIFSTDLDLTACETYTAGELSAYYKDPHARGPINSIPPFSLQSDEDVEIYDYTIKLPHLVQQVNVLYSNEPEYSTRS